MQFCICIGNRLYEISIANLLKVEGSAEQQHELHNDYANMSRCLMRPADRVKRFKPCVVRCEIWTGNRKRPDCGNFLRAHRAF